MIFMETKIGESDTNSVVDVDRVRGGGVRTGSEPGLEHVLFFRELVEGNEHLHDLLVGHEETVGEDKIDYGIQFLSYAWHHNGTDGIYRKEDGAVFVLDRVGTDDDVGDLKDVSLVSYTSIGVLFPEHGQDVVTIIYGQSGGFQATRQTDSFVFHLITV
jgi:hypothetical protein